MYVLAGARPERRVGELPGLVRLEICGRDPDTLRALRTEGLVRSRRDGKMVMCALTADGAALVDSLLAQEEVATRRACGS